MEIEDQHFVCLSDESDNEFVYHERVGPEITEIWNLTEEDIDSDFNLNQHIPSVDVQASRTLGKVKSLVHWLLLFVCLWSSFCSLSDNAMDILLSFLRAFFEAVGSTIPMVTSVAVLIPKSLHLLRKEFGLHEDSFIKFVVCPKCENLYNFDDCHTLRFGKRLTKKCSFVEFPNHRQHFRRTKCSEPLLREVNLKSGQTRLYPYKVYCYNSIISTLQRFLQRPNFMTKIESWRDRKLPNGFMADVFDGRIWKEWQYVNGKSFLASPRNCVFMLNVDWFQPFKHSVYSVGVLYMVLMNLPRAERFKPENVFLVGIIPGPREPKGNINSYLQPLVAELNLLWKEGIKVKSEGSEEVLLSSYCSTLCWL